MLPSLNLSSGPAVSDAAGTSASHTTTTTGDFVFGRKSPGLIETALPWVAIAGIVWWMTRKN